MGRFKKLIISFLIILVNLIMLIALRSVPVSRIWEGYSVLYVDRNASEAAVLDELYHAGCRDVISLGLQKVPLNSPFAKTVSSSAYLTSRLQYFFDSSLRYQLYYIPLRYEESLSSAVKNISKNLNVSCGLDGKQKSLWTVPLVVCVFFGLLLFFSPKRLVFAISGVFFVLITFSLPFYSVGAASCLALTLVFFSQRLWGRKNNLKVLIKNIYLDVLALVSFAVFVFSSWRALVLGLLAFASSASALLILKEYENYRDSKSAFNFVPLFSASQINVVYRENIKFFLYTAGSVFICAVLFMFSARFSSASVSSVSLPSPVRAEQTSSIPSLRDFFVWAWQVESFPYKSMNHSGENSDEIPYDGEKLMIEHYEASRNGITTSQSEVMRFDEAFRNTQEQKIDSLDYPAVEKLMKKQGKNVSVIYNSAHGSRKHSDVMSLILILTALLVPLLIYAHYTFLGRGKYENS